MPNAGEGLQAMKRVGAIDWDGTPLLHACQLAESEVIEQTKDYTKGTTMRLSQCGLGPNTNTDDFVKLAEDAV